MATVLPHSRWNEGSVTTPSLYPTTVPRSIEYPALPAWGLLDRAAKLKPDRVACVYYDLQWTYKELNRDAMQLASLLRASGVGKGDRVGVLLPNVPEYTISVNGIWRAGAIAVAFSPLMVRGEVDQLLKSTECKVVISLDMLSHLLVGDNQPRKTILISIRQHLNPIKQLGYFLVRHQRTGQWWMSEDEKTTWFWEEMSRAEPLEQAASCDPMADAAYILPTGGTTGEPKAVTLSHFNLVANAWQQYHWAGASVGKEKLMGVLPFFHSYGLSTTVLGGAAMAATVVLHHRFNTRRVIQLMEIHQPTVFHAVPAMLVAMNEQLRKRKARLNSLKWVISGGAGLPEEVGKEFADHTGALVVEGYGLSESSPVTHAGPLNENARYGTIGLPLPDTFCRIVDQETATRELPAGEIGELLVRGPQIMLGYWKDPDATHKAIRDGWLHTGDLARITESGLYQIKERKKDLVITSGYNVYPREVESVIKECPGVTDVAIIGIPDAERGEIVKAFVVLEKGASWDEKLLVTFCHEHLSSHKRPRIFEHCPNDLPRNFLGKVIRRHLRDNT